MLFNVVVSSPTLPPLNDCIKNECCPQNFVLTDPQGSENEIIGSGKIPSSYTNLLYNFELSPLISSKTFIIINFVLGSTGYGFCGKKRCIGYSHSMVKYLKPKTSLKILKWTLATHSNSVKNEKYFCSMRKRILFFYNACVKRLMINYIGQDLLTCLH